MDRDNNAKIKVARNTINESFYKCLHNKLNSICFFPLTMVPFLKKTFNCKLLRVANSQLIIEWSSIKVLALQQYVNFINPLLPSAANMKKEDHKNISIDCETSYKGTP